MESSFCRPDTRLIETFGWDGGAFRRLDAHLARARASAGALGFFWDESAIRAALGGVTGAAPLRVRLTIGRDGGAEVTTGPLAPTPPLWRLTLAKDRLPPNDPRLHHTQWGADGLVLQLHSWEADHHHGHLGDPDVPVGNGTMLWFEVDDFDDVANRARELHAPVVLDVHVNPNAGHRELWITDPDGYTVVIASPDGTA